MCTRIRKGIINPNYPGFQSLAYTLNDDHFDYSSENPSDDDEDSYVSESDDNEMKRMEQDEMGGDENGNSYDRIKEDGQEDEDADESGLQLHASIQGPAVSLGQEKLCATLYHQSTTIGAENTYGSSPAQRSRMRLTPNGCSSPSLIINTTIESKDKLDATGIYACTPPDILLEHSCDHRMTVLGSTNEQLKASSELANSQRPDLIPEHQLQQKINNVINKQNFRARNEEPFSNNRADVDTPVDDAIEADDGDDEQEDDEADEADSEGNRTPPSPATELAAIGTISISNSDSSINFLRNVTLSPDPMLDDATRCYGSVSEATLSDDTDHSDAESDEAEFGYQPYDDHCKTIDNQHTPEVVETPDSADDSAGSSPGELQYHLVDDCSNQTVQITRSRQTSDHSATNQYHALMQQYSSLSATDFCNNQVRLAENEMDCNEVNRYHSLEELAQTKPALSEGESRNVSFDHQIINDGLVSTDYPDARLQSLSVRRRSQDACAQESRNGQNIPPMLSKEEKATGDTIHENVEGVDPAKRYQKVPKVNPFCELLLHENDTCDFFTKQAKLQIEARMALCQAKDMAHMQMEIEKRSLPLSPVTKVIHTAVEKAGLCLAQDKRRLSRYYLTRLNVAQLQTILLELQCHAEVLNEELVQLLMERDELHISQDATLIDIEDLSRYLCAKEQTIIHAERQRKSYHWNNSRTVYHPGKPKQSLPLHQSPPPAQQPRSTYGVQPTIPAYRYH